MDLNIWNLKTLSTTEKGRILKRSEADISQIMHKVQPIIDDVRCRGDEALYDYARRFDKADIQDGLKATDEDFERAYDQVDTDVVQAIKLCAENVRIHHEQQMERTSRQWMDEVKPGLYAGEKITAIPSVGLYVPRGKGAFPSAMYMLCIPAVVAGVSQIAVCTPPTPEGHVDAASLIAADICGVRNVYKVGGAQAIAALAYGTQTVPKVAKVLGPGSPYVAAAKKLLSDVIDPGMPAGPSESIIVADELANPWNVALDLLNEAEHGTDSAALLVTSDEGLIEQVRDNLEKIMNDMPAKQRSICQDVLTGYGGILLTGSYQETIDFCNEYAVEHLYLHVQDMDWWVERLNHAGEIIMGDVATISMANFGVGVNHVLPTGGHAKTYSCTSVWDFLKRTSLVRMDRVGFDAIKDVVIKMSEYEDFPAHGNSVKKRHL